MEQDAVIEQLEKILASPHFAPSKRLSRFLRLVVEETLSGKAAHLKEYRIGVEVFDKGTDFDPRLDSIVRVQAAKLRSKLLEYYAEQGQQDPITISIPRGSYAPEIHDAKPSAEAKSDSAPAVAIAPASDLSRIAVLPFVSMSSDPENQHFSDGLTEELINRLTHVPSLNVVARTSAFSFKGRNEDVRDIGKKLNVRNILEGSVRKSDRHLRVTAQLIDVETGFHLFSRTYNRELKNVFELQDELAMAVVEEIAPTTTLAASNVKIVNIDAYNTYLKGTYALSNNIFGIPEAIERFHEALRLDPDFVPAWAGIAHASFLLAWFSYLPAKEAFPLSKQAALKTLELDPNSGQGHASLGLVECGFEWRWAAAEARFKRAIELQPGFAAIYAFYAAACLNPQGRFNEACTMLERAIALDPFNPMYRAMATLVYLGPNRVEDAMRSNTLGLEINPNFPPLVASGAVLLERQGRIEEAIARYRRCVELTGGRSFFQAFLAHLLGLSGQEGEAKQILEQMLAMPDPPAMDIARIYLGLRDWEQTFHWLDKTVEIRNVHLLALPVDYRFDPIRQHPRFQNILHMMSLPHTTRMT